MKVAIVVPPFAGIDRPSLSAHILQACADSAGFQTTVVYANFRYAKIIGEEQYSFFSSLRRKTHGMKVFFANRHSG